MTIRSKYFFILPVACVLVFLLILLNLFSFLTIPVLIFVSLISLAIIFSLYNDRVLILLMVFSIPLSVIVQPFSSGSIIFPSELFAGLLAMIFFLRLLYAENYFSINRSFLKHPITLFVVIYFAALLVSSIFSTLPLVSWKSTLVRLCYISVFYFMIHHFFKTHAKNIVIVFLLYGFSLTLVIGYAILNLNSLGLYKSNAAASVIPFYGDHTMYSAAIAFVIPAFAAIVFSPKTFLFNLTSRVVIFIALLLFIAGIYLSFCRAAWISVVSAFVIFILMLMNFRFLTFIFLFAGIIVYASFSYPKLIEAFRQNKFDSNVKNAGFYEQTRSITNITNDVSNAERLNRWSCAVRMFRDKPITGFGIGTYQFQYLPYQRKEEMTRISVTSPYDIPLGHGGSTHSEYLVALSESGIFSLLSFLGLLFTSLFTGLKIFSKSEDKKTRLTACFILLGLVTYFTHGLFNNFLENDKLAFLFWSSLSILATLDSSSEMKQTMNKVEH